MSDNRRAALLAAAALHWFILGSRPSSPEIFSWSVIFSALPGVSLVRVRGYHCILSYLYARNDCCKLPGRTFSFVATEQTHPKKTRYEHPNNHLRKAGAVSDRRSPRQAQAHQ